MPARKSRRKLTRVARKPAAKSRAVKPARKAKPARKSASAGPSPSGAPGIGLNFHHLDYTTHDLEAMKRFFSETLGFTRVVYEPKVKYMTVFVTPTSSIGFMPPMSGAPDQWRPPGEPVLYFFVDDVDEAWRQLKDRGVSFEQEPRDMPWGHRVAILKDPEGRGVCLAQRPGK